MSANKLLRSALPPLVPVEILDTKSGLKASPSELQSKIHKIFSAVTVETDRLYAAHKDLLLEELQSYEGSPAPAEFARQKGITASFRSSLPREVKAKSRLEKIVQHKLISETASYVLNPQGRKKEHSFGKTFSLGAVDKQMATISMSDDEIVLLWTCWDVQYYITFNLPKYVSNRIISKVSLPTVRLNSKTGKYEFFFTVFEETKSRKGSKHVAGLDIGVILPYSLAMVNAKGERVADYKASRRLQSLARKKSRLIAETKSIGRKIRNRATRGLESPLQKEELKLRNDKLSRLTKALAGQVGSEVANRLAKHNSNLLAIEDLSWLSGTHGSKIRSSRWSHSKELAAITHATSRVGYKTKKVSAKNTSQLCHQCGLAISHNVKRRTVRCAECKTVLDRDFNAAMNIAKSALPFPVNKKLNRGITGKTITADAVSDVNKGAPVGVFELPAANEISCSDST